MANRLGSAQNEQHEAYGWSRGKQAGTSGHRKSPLLLLTTGLLPVVVGDPSRGSFQPAFVEETGYVEWTTGPARNKEVGDRGCMSNTKAAAIAAGCAISSVGHWWILPTATVRFVGGSAVGW